MRPLPTNPILPNFSLYKWGSGGQQRLGWFLSSHKLTLLREEPEGGELQATILPLGGSLPPASWPGQTRESRV